MSTESQFQTADRATIREERKRLARTRRLLQTALDQPVGDWAATLAFFQACVGFLDVSTQRLIAQDISLVVQLRPTLPKERKDDHDFLDELEARLTLRKGELAQLGEATKALAQNGQAGLPAFKAAVAAYFTAPSTAVSRPMHSLPPLIEAFGSPKCFEVAQAAADACGSELEAYKVIEARMLPGLLDIVLALEREQPSGRPMRGAA